MNVSIDCICMLEGEYFKYNCDQNKIWTLPSQCEWYPRSMKKKSGKGNVWEG